MRYIYLLLGVVGFLMLSCDDRDKEIDFIKQQHRDPKMIGFWERLSNNPFQKETDSEVWITEYKVAGTFVNYCNGRKNLTKYFYTKDDDLITYYDTGCWTDKPIKNKYRYQIKQDTLRLYYYDKALQRYLDEPSIYLRVEGIESKNK